MPLFYFDVHDGVSGLDSVGIDCRDEQAACRHALGRAERLLAEQADWFRTGQTWQIGVVGASGQTLLSLTFKAHGGGAVMASVRAGLPVAGWGCEHLERALTGPSETAERCTPTRRLFSPAGSADRHAYAARP